jgi:hypothetical protein
MPPIKNHSNELTYSVRANSCDGMSVAFEQLQLDVALRVVEALLFAFRDVCATCEQTGEVACNMYYAKEVFIPETSLAQAVVDACRAIEA